MRDALTASTLCALALGLLSLDTDACSCVPARLARTTLPADGATGVPTDAAVRVFLRGFPAGLRSALASEYRLTDPQGAEVALDASVVATRLDLRPHTALRPRTRYTLARLYAYDAAGTLLSDTERLEHSDDRDRPAQTNAPSLRRAWFSEGWFETGDGPATPRAVTPERLGATLNLRYGGGDCGPGVALNATFRLPQSAAATDLAALEVRAPGFAPALVATLPATTLTSLYASDLLCAPDPVYVPARGPVEVRVVALDAAGSSLGASPWTLASEPRRSALPANWESERRGTSPSVGTLPQRWLAPPIVRATAPATRGPAACAHGFEVTARSEVAAAGAPWSYEGLSTLSIVGDSAWVTVNANRDGTLSRLLSVPAQGPAMILRPALRGTVTATASGASGPLLVTRTFGRPEAATLLSLDRDGRTLWQRPLRAARDGHRVAVGPRRVLVLDGGAQTLQTRALGWALFDARTGAPVGPARDGSEQSSSDGSVAATWARDHFVIAWTVTDPSRHMRVRVATLTADGSLRAPVTLPIAADGPIDLAASGDRVALVSADEGVVSWTLLDGAGAVQRGPVELSSGVGGRDNRKPRVSARDGLFAVSWEAYPSGAVYATAIDATGALAPALRVADSDAGTVFVAPRGDGSFLASYATGVGVGRSQVASLRCRADAPSGPPQRIDAAR